MKQHIAMLLENPFAPDLRVLREAQSLIKAGHSVTIFAWDREISGRPEHETVDGIDVVRIAIKSKHQRGWQQIFYYLAFAWRAVGKVMRGEFDVIYCHDFLNLIPGVLIRLFKHIPLIYDAHEIYAIMEARKYSPSVLAAMKRIELFFMRFVDAFITVGENRAKYYREQGYSRQIFVVGNWYDPRNREPEAGKELRMRLGISEDAFVATFAGTLSQTRAADILIQSSQQSNGHQGRCVHWIVAGFGPAAEQFERAARDNERLHYLGWIEDMMPVFSASDALLYLMDLSHPYANYNSPNNLYLSIAWGLPLVAVAAGEIQAVLDTEENGVLLSEITPQSVNSAILRLAEDDAFYQHITQGLVNLQTRYNWDAAQGRLFAALEAAQIYNKK